MELQSENINMYSMRVLTAVIAVGTLVFYSSIMKLYNCKQDIKILLFLKSLDKHKDVRYNIYATGFKNPKQSN